MDKADKYWRDSWQKNLRNKLENRISVSEPLNDNQRGFNAGDLKKKNSKECTYFYTYISITYKQQKYSYVKIFSFWKYTWKMEILHLSAIQFCI